MARGKLSDNRHCPAAVEPKPASSALRDATVMASPLTVAAVGVTLHAVVATPVASTARAATMPAGMRFTAAMLPGATEGSGPGRLMASIGWDQLPEQRHQGGGVPSGGGVWRDGDRESLGLGHQCGAGGQAAEPHLGRGREDDRGQL